MKFKILAVFLIICAVAGVGCNPLEKLPVNALRPSGHLPDDGFGGVWNLYGKKRWFAGNKLNEYIGQQAAVFREYGFSLLTTSDYKRGENSEPELALESYEMENHLAASGIFHYHRGRVLRGQGMPADVGIEGVLKADQTVLYFYKGLYFFKVIYTGNDPQKRPDLIALGRIIADDVPGGVRPPRGFEYLDVQGVEPKKATLSSGYTFNYDFLPPSIMCDAPGAGEIAKAFIIGHYEEKDAVKTERDYRYFLEKKGLDYGIKRSANKRLVWWARDPGQGRVIVTRYRNWIIGVLAPQTYDRGEVILDRIVARIQGH